MKVAELMRLLAEQDPDAEVLIMSQPRWPFEYSVHGVALRSEIEQFEQEDGATEGRRPDGRAANDVFIVEGQQLRYGSKAAWEVATR